MSEIIDKEHEVIDTNKLEEKKNNKLNIGYAKKPFNRVNKIVQTSTEVKISVADPLVERIPKYNQDSLLQLGAEAEANMQYDETGELINKASLGPGLTLKNIRTEAKLSKEDVAKELRLALRHIEYLENDNFEKFTALAFYIGYLRNYSKLLELDPDKMVAKFYAVYKVMPEKVHYKHHHIASKTWYDVWPMKLFLSNEHKQFEKTKNVKSLIFGCVIAMVFLCLWWLLSTTGTRTTVEPVKVENLSAEAVDNLLPSQPVIAQNSSSAVSVNQASETILSQSNIDNLSPAPSLATNNLENKLENKLENQTENQTGDKLSDKVMVDTFPKRSKLDDISSLS